MNRARNTDHAARAFVYPIVKITRLYDYQTRQTFFKEWFFFFQHATRNDVFLHRNDYGHTSRFRVYFSVFLFVVVVVVVVVVV